VANRLGPSASSHLDAEPHRRRTDFVETSRRREVLSDDQRRSVASACWEESVGTRGTIAETYLSGRGLHGVEYPHVIRFHPRCAWREGEQLLRVPGLVAAMRHIQTDELMAVSCRRLTLDGKKVGKPRFRGVAGGAAIKLDSDDVVTMGLAIGEGVETCLAARQIGLKPCWALGSKGAIGAFPVLAGIDALTILAEPDATKEVEDCAARWYSAGREVIIVRPTVGKDINDAIRGAA
jgi:hypothetical protein